MLSDDTAQFENIVFSNVQYAVFNAISILCYIALIFSVFTACYLILSYASQF